jgi:hypothetical protein
LTVWYRVLLLDTRGRTVEVVPYGMDYIITLEEADPLLLRAVFPEVPSDGLVGRTEMSAFLWVRTT